MNKKYKAGYMLFTHASDYHHDGLLGSILTVQKYTSDNIYVYAENA